jgi:hypothetical protein
MLEQVANVLVHALYLYGTLGFIFAIPFVVKGVQRIDEEAVGTGWGFRVLIVPGSVAFWPMLLKRWLGRQRTPPEERNPHQ